MNKNLANYFLICSMIIFIIIIGGCSSENKDDKLIINSYESSKIMPTTIFEIEMQNKYLLDELYEIKVKYGHLRNVHDNDIELEYTPIALFQIHHFEDEYNKSLSFEELISCTILFERKNFYSSEYTVVEEIIRGKKNIEYKNEETINIPKEVIKNESGLISLSLTTFYLDDNNQFGDSYEGSVIYIKYKVEDDKIIFLKK